MSYEKDLCPKVFVTEIENSLRNSSNNSQHLQYTRIDEFSSETLPPPGSHIEYTAYKILGSSTTTFMRYKL